MIHPHGGRLVDRVVTDDRAADIRSGLAGVSIPLTVGEYQDLRSLAVGRFSPLSGFLDETDLRTVWRDGRLEDGTVWPVSITLEARPSLADDLPFDRLVGPSGDTVGAIEVTGVCDTSRTAIAEGVFGTTDRDHPGARRVRGSDSADSSSRNVVSISSKRLLST